MQGHDCYLWLGRFIGKKSMANKFANDACIWGQYIMAKYPTITNINPTLSSDDVAEPFIFRMDLPTVVRFVDKLRK